MKRLLIPAAIIAATVALILSQLPPPQANQARDRTAPPEEPGTSGPSASQSAAAGEVAPAEGKPQPLPSDDPRLTRFSDGSVHLNQSITASRRLHQSPDPGSDLEILAQLLTDYRFFYRENPVGTENVEIVAQLLGGNPHRVFFLDPELEALTPEGTLLDRWGSPYRFHPLTATEMDIRSLGPDRQPWTPDDLSLDFSELERALQLNPGE